MNKILKTTFTIFLLSFTVLNSMNKEKEHNSRKLLIAVAAGDDKAVKELLSKNIDVNFRDANGNTPLHLAAQTYNVAIIDLLLNKSTGFWPLKTYPANINAQNNDGDTPLILAIRHKKVPVIQALITNPNHDIKVNIKNKLGDTALHVALEIPKANVTSNAGITDEDRAKIVALLISKGADVNARDNNDYSPLNLAALYNRANIIPILINNKAIIDAKNKRDETALYIAAQHGSVEALNELLKAGANPNEETLLSLVPLHVATMLNKIDAVKALLNYNKTDKDKVTDKRIKNLAKPKNTFFGGETALHFAAYTGNKDLVNLLLNAGVDADMENTKKQTAADMARAQGHTEIAEAIEQKMTKPVKPLPDLPTLINNLRNLTMTLTGLANRFSKIL